MIGFNIDIPVGELITKIFNNNTEKGFTLPETRYTGIFTLDSSEVSNNINFIITAKLNHINGKGTVQGSDGITDINVNGTVIDNGLFILIYSSKDPLNEFGGSMIIEKEGIKLNGKFIGYGQKSRKLISGSIDLKKV